MCSSSVYIMCPLCPHPLSPGLSLLSVNCAGGGNYRCFSVCTRGTLVTRIIFAAVNKHVLVEESAVVFYLFMMNS